MHEFVHLFSSTESDKLHTERDVSSFYSSRFLVLHRITAILLEQINLFPHHDSCFSQSLWLRPLLCPWTVKFVNF